MKKHSNIGIKCPNLGMNYFLSSSVPNSLKEECKYYHQIKQNKKHENTIRSSTSQINNMGYLPVFYELIKRFDGIENVLMLLLCFLIMYIQ
jgi:hypothetical protein